jgi:hypothetical protein
VKAMLVFSLTTLILSGCEADPVMLPQQSHAATIYQPKHIKGEAYAYIFSVDGNRTVGVIGSYPQVYQVTPGEHEVRLDCASGSRDAFAHMRTTFLSDHYYEHIAR